MSLMGTKEIMEIIPHRQPFLLIDTIEELEPGKRAVAKKCVSYNEPFFGGHFPGEPVMPGVLIIEALVMSASLLAIWPNSSNCSPPRTTWRSLSSCATTSSASRSWRHSAERRCTNPRRRKRHFFCEDSNCRLKNGLFG